MPLYSYTTDDGDTFEFPFPMKKQPDFVQVGDGRIAYRDIAADWRGRHADNTEGWPIHSDAAGCHPDQIPEMQAHLASRGVKADYTPDGRVILENRGHRRQVLRALGLHDRDGGYGDG